MCFMQHASLNVVCVQNAVFEKNCLRSYLFLHASFVYTSKKFCQIGELQIILTNFPRRTCRSVIFRIWPQSKDQ